jgi:hypothetical protein
MRRLFFCAVLALGALAVGGGVARASGVQNINPYHCPSGVGVGFGSPWVVSATESGGDPVRMNFGWAALQTNQLDKFISVESGTVTLTDPNGNVVYHDSWGGDMTGWDAYNATQVTPNGTTFKSGFGTKRHELFGGLSNPNPGTDAVYNLTMDWELGKAVNDGFGAYGPGPIVQVTNCPIIVHNYN